MLPRSCHTYLSSDIFHESSEHPDIDDIHPPERLHGLTFFPNNEIQLKIGAPVVLLRNLDPYLGLCNEVRFVVEHFGSKVLKARITTGRNIGQKLVISHIDLTTFADDTPFALKRRQFPIKLQFAMQSTKVKLKNSNMLGFTFPN